MQTAQVGAALAPLRSTQPLLERWALFKVPLCFEGHYWRSGVILLHLTRLNSFLPDPQFQATCLKRLFAP